MTVCVVTRVTPDHKIAQEAYTHSEPACEKLLHWAKGIAYKANFSLKAFDDFESSVRADIYHGTRGEHRTFIIGECTLYYKEFLIDDKTGSRMPPY